MSIFGRLMAGAGAGAVQVASKYIDEEISNNRAQFLADLEQKNFEKRDQYQNSDAVQQRRNANATAGTLAQAAAARQAKTEGVADTGYQAALDAEADADTGRKVKSANQVMEGTTAAEVKRNAAIGAGKTDEDIRRATAMLPLEVKKAYAVADAAGRASARNREAPGADLQAKISIMEKSLDRPLTEMEKMGLFGLASKGDPARDTVKITEEEMLPGGGSRKTERTEVRRGGQGGGNKLPEADAHAQAQAAIKAGASADAVNKLLADKGYRALPAAEKKTDGARPAPASARAQADPEDDERTLKRIAGMPGHARQAYAKAELARRAAAKPDVDTSGFGFGYTGG